ncbi:hypothetical protein DVH05_015466 [Phytophthora capsici]|nr:hypothetical protein DVH05_015466 [Phytophthora capsici]
MCSITVAKTSGFQDLVSNFFSNTDVTSASNPDPNSTDDRTWAGCPQLSFWAPSHDLKGGVAILIDPYGAFKTAEPFMEHLWSPHFMAVRGVVQGSPMLVINVYAPHRPALRERFFRSLRDLDIPQDANVAVGGDFNCTLDNEADRSWRTAATTHDSAALRELCDIWGLLDPIAESRPPEWDPQSLQRHRAATHTYYYSVNGQGEASSRLDRWYVTGALGKWVAGWEVLTPGAPADHLGAKLLLEVPGDPIRIKRPPRTYPVPAYALEAVQTGTEELLEDYLQHITKDKMSALSLATSWDALKARVVDFTLATIRGKRRQHRRTLKQKLRRLEAQKQRLDEAKAGVPASVASKAKHHGPEF